MTDAELVSWADLGRRVQRFTAALEAAGFGVVEAWHSPAWVELTITVPDLDADTATAAVLEAELEANGRAPG